ncbi:MFS transporter [Flexivirga oryzae]|uniref:MFS family permease n=1 Tax=Flexivirga oryzae TaxID=1794944 RepID=A0A839NGU5_9MICO|nr:MFS transporter [Flexivirga oryzae]MBB2893891.1 MFS family permease [Flexivirga oryzae]
MTGTSQVSRPTTEEIARVQRRTLRIVMTGQVFGGAGLAAGATVGALIAKDLLGGEGLAGLPTALSTLGSAFAAYLVGRASRRLGRRPALAGGFLLGGLGAAGVVFATATRAVPLFFVALFVYGAGSATNLQSRYAGTDLARPHQRGHAASIALVATTVGAVAGPSLVDPLGVVSVSLGLPRLSGMFALAAVAYTVAGLTFLLLMRPDPLLLSRQVPDQTPEPGAMGAGTPVTASGRHHVALGATTMIATQVAMVAVMTMTPVAMQSHGHGLGAAGAVIAAHIAAMYLLSPISGALVDRWGRLPTAMLSVTVLLVAGLCAAMSSGDSMVLVTIALMLLGFGWNLGLIAGTALVVDGTAPDRRPQVQGSIDVLVALAGAGAGAASGVVSAAFNYPTLAILCGLVGAAAVPVAVRLRLAQAPLPS